MEPLGRSQVSDSLNPPKQDLKVPLNLTEAIAHKEETEKPDDRGRCLTFLSQPPR
jgi:hypothetical protein